MRTRWTSAIVGGAAIGMLAVGAVALMSRNDNTNSVAAPSTPSLVSRTITVSGEGTVTVKPDTATIQMGVQATSPTATDALAQANKAAAALIAALKATGIADDDIVTSGLSIYPQYNNSNRISGYQASNNVTVTVRSIDQAGPVIDAAAAAAGENVTIGGISFSVSNPEQVIGTARANAIDNAKKRAAEYAAAAGVQVGAVMQITEVSVSQPPVYWADRTAGSDAATTPVQTGTQDLTVVVTVVWELA